MHDRDEYGNRRADTYTNETISKEYLNKLLIRDFERAFTAAGFDHETHPVPFGSRYARWTRRLLRISSLRELVSGYVWFVLTKPAVPAESRMTRAAAPRLVASTRASHG